MGRWFRSSRDIAGVCVLLGLILMSTTNSYFLTTDNFDSIQTLIAVNGTLAVGMMVLLIGGFFDLSVGSVMGLAGIVCAVLLHEGFPIGLAIGMTLLFGAAVGMVNGFLVSRLQINPLIATLGTMFMGRGIIETIATTQTLTGFTGFPPAFLEIGAGKVFGIYLMFWIFLRTMALGGVLVGAVIWDAVIRARRDRGDLYDGFGA